MLMQRRFEFTLQAADHAAAWRFMQRRLVVGARRGAPHLAWIALFVVLYACIAFALVMLGEPGPSPHWWLLAAAVGAMFIALHAYARYVNDRVREHQYRGIAKHDATRTIALDEHGIAVHSAHGARAIGWPAVAAVEHADGATLIGLHSGDAWVIPHRAFATRGEQDEVEAFLRSKIGAPAATPAEAPQAAENPFDPPRARVEDAATESGPGYLQGLRANLIGGLRLAAFMPVAAAERTTNPLLAATLVALAVVLHLARDLAIAGANGEFSGYGLPGLLFYVPFTLFAGALLAWMAGRGDRAAVVTTALLALYLPIQFVELGIHVLLVQGEALRWAYGPLVLYGPLVWFALAAAAAAVRLLELRAQAAFVAYCVTTVVIALPLATIYHDGTLWHRPYDEQAAEARSRYEAIASEDAFYQQPKLLERSLAAVTPGRRGTAELYFLGVGGYAHQDVFLKEIRAVEQMMVERFGAAGRTVALVNNPRTVMETPIASATALKAALKRIGEAMNREEDILFLFMTSHGSKDHKFSLEFWPLKFNDLTPGVLREALDDAGVKWRAIVVSACYAGGFIDALRDEQTIVIAAAGPDRKSFGCSNQNEWTYFGQAFFDEALRHERSLTRAFEMARESVTAREQKEGIRPPSDPKMAAGEAMVAKWQEFTRAIEHAAGSRVVSDAR
jgi:hypothetical protein